MTDAPESPRTMLRGTGLWPAFLFLVVATATEIAGRDEPASVIVGLHDGWQLGRSGNDAW